MDHPCFWTGSLGFRGPFPKTTCCCNKTLYAPGLVTCEPRGRGCRISAEGLCLQPCSSMTSPAWLGRSWVPLLRESCQHDRLNPELKQLSSCFFTLNHKAASQEISISPLPAEDHTGHATAVPFFSIPWLNGVLSSPGIYSC